MESSSCNVWYTTKEIPGKGHGLFAETAITKGTRIFSESPFIKFDMPRRVMTEQQIRELLSKQTAALQPGERQALLSLHNFFEEDGPEIGRLRTNVLGLEAGIVETRGTPNIRTCGVFLYASRINHSCTPNTERAWNEILQKVTVHARQDISKGDEITTYNLEFHGSRSTRINELQRTFNFTCSCSHCSLPPDQQKTSDQRRVRIQQITNFVRYPTIANSTPLRTLHSIHKLLKVLHAEGLDGTLVSMAYTDALQTAAMNSDEARARVFAERAGSNRIIFEGDDSPRVQRMNELANDPSQYKSYGLSNGWATTRDDVPDDLGEEEFEQWLWREATEFADLRREADFPSYKNIRGDYTSHSGFCRVTGKLMLRMPRHWCFLAEVLEVVPSSDLKLLVKDKANDTVMLDFLPDERAIENSLTFRKKGSTVAVLYAERPDDTGVIQIIWPRLAKAFPFKLDQLLTLNDNIQNYAMKRNGMRKCHGCDQEAGTLRACSQCGFFWYCNKDCQSAGWIEKSHKRDCKMLKDRDVREMFTLNWEVFEDSLMFPLDPFGIEE